jgi:hypothetical protein
MKNKNIAKAIVSSENHMLAVYFILIAVVLAFAGILQS